MSIGRDSSLDWVPDPASGVLGVVGNICCLVSSSGPSDIWIILLGVAAGMLSWTKTSPLLKTSGFCSSASTTTTLFLPISVQDLAAVLLSRIRASAPGFKYLFLEFFTRFFCLKAMDSGLIEDVLFFLLLTTNSKTMLIYNHFRPSFSNGTLLSITMIKWIMIRKSLYQSDLITSNYINRRNFFLQTKLELATWLPILQQDEN